MPVSESPLVLVFLKAPRPGLVKSRLAKDIGDENAATIYRMLVERQLAAIPSDWPLEIHYTPTSAAEEMRGWLGANRNYVPQPDGSLGRRLQCAFARAFADGATAAMAIGGDCPELDTGCFHRAKAILERHDVAVGPAFDGGYYLLGLRAPAPVLFEQIPWSSENVLSSTMARIAATGLTAGTLEMKEDIDDLEGLKRVAARAGLDRALRLATESAGTG